MGKPYTSKRSSKFDKYPQMLWLGVYLMVAAVVYTAVYLLFIQPEYGAAAYFMDSILR